MNKISIFGYLPPPVGGVSIHIERVSAQLNKLGILERVYNFGTPKGYSKNGLSTKVRNIKISTRFDIIGYFYWLTFFCTNDKSKVIHFHNNENGSFAILIAKLIFHKKIIITVHDQMRLLRKAQWFRAWYVTPFVSMLYKQSDIYWIAVSENIKNQLVAKGVNPKMISIIPAYIKNIEDKHANFNSNVENFLAQHSPLLSIYAMSTRVLDNVDLYGIDLSLSLVSNLKITYPNIGLMICIPGDKNEEIMTNHERYIANHSLGENVLIIKENVTNSTRLWQLSDIFLRPTNTDGDSLCVREALDVKTIVLASDSAIRPLGTILFKNRDVNSFTLKARYILENKSIIKNNLTNISDNFDDLFKLYTKCLG